MNKLQFIEILKNDTSFKKIIYCKVSIFAENNEKKKNYYNKICIFLKLSCLMQSYQLKTKKKSHHKKIHYCETEVSTHQRDVVLTCKKKGSAHPYYSETTNCTSLPRLEYCFFILGR